jgi:hypothetical protein
MDIALSKDSIMTLLAEQKREYNELRGRFDALGLELEKEKAARVSLEDPSVLEKRVQARIDLVENCHALLGEEITIEGKSDEELKFDVINKFYPEQKIPHEDASYVEGMFNAICGMKAMRNESLTAAREAIQNNSIPKAQNGYEKWLEHSATLWSIPLAGAAR